MLRAAAEDFYQLYWSEEILNETHHGLSRLSADLFAECHDGQIQRASNEQRFDPGACSYHQSPLFRLMLRLSGILAGLFLMTAACGDAKEAATDTGSEGFADQENDGLGGTGNSGPTGTGNSGGHIVGAGGATSDGTAATSGGAAAGGAATGGAPSTIDPSSGGSSAGGNPSGSGGRTDDQDTGGTSNGGTGSGAGGDSDPSGHVRDPSLPTYPFSDPDAKYPFPQMVDYGHGVQSDALGHEVVAEWYQNWKGRYLQSCNGMIMPRTENSSTSKVEAQGFGMIAVAYMADKDTFDGLYAFYNSKLQASSCGLSAWITSCGGVQDSGAATDGDIDVASALLIAHWQWPDEGYDEEARAILERLKEVLVECGDLTALYPGCSGGRPWGGCDETDISYYSPGFFRYFAKLTGDDIWEKLADDTSVIRDNAAHPNTGLVPDWQSVEGRAGAGERVGHYGFDALRAPFKQALDFLWHGNEATGAWCEKITNWASSVGAGRLVDGYQLDGSPVGRTHNMAVVGSLAVCASANTQQIVDEFVAESGNLRDDFWYSGYLGNLYLLAMTGNMWHRDMMAD